MTDKLFDAHLCMENVSHQFGSTEVVREFSLDVSPGEVIVLVGPSGCGKTTLLNLLSGHIEPGSGKILRKGVIRTAYQEDGLFPWLTVAENIRLGLQSIKEKEKQKNELLELVDMIHLEGFEDFYPHQLSGGMRQRVELARVIAGDSDILLMDEPFSALDYQTRLRMRQELVSLLNKRPRTVVFVTHDIEEAAQLADRVMVLTSRPARISKELKISSPRPRNLTDHAVVEAMKTILEELGLQVIHNPHD